MKLKPHTTRWRVPLAAWVPIAIAVAAEATTNGIRAYALGSELEQFTTTIRDVPVSLAGVVLVLGAAAISLTQTRAFWVAMTPGDTRQRWTAGLAALLLITISVTAMASHILEANRTKSGHEGSTRENRIDARSAYNRALEEFERVKGAKTPAQVEAAASEAGARLDANIWRKTKNCTETTQRASIDECKSVTKIRAGLADAKRKAELEAELATLKEELSGTKPPDEASETELVVSRLWGWLIAIGVVGIATAGPVLFARVETSPVSGNSEFRETVRAANDAVAVPVPPKPTPPRGTRGRKLDKRVVVFADEFRKRHGQAPSAGDIRAAFPGMPSSTAYDYVYRCRA